MKNRLPLRSALLAAGLMIPITLTGGARSAGLFDAIGSIFGGDPEPPPSYQPAPRGYYGDGGSLDVTVRPRRLRPPRRERRVVRRERPAPAPLANLDPTSNPNWYLEDPTLRAGDVVVLKGEVLVFQGGRVPYAREDFTSLDRSKLSKDERARIGAMAGLPVSPAAGDPVDRKRVTAATEPAQ
jgi:hypothetical protein